MARKPVPVNPPLPPAGPDGQPIAPDTFDDRPDGLEMLAGEGRVRIYRESIDGRSALVATMDRADLVDDVERIGRNYGPGNYRLDGIGPDGRYEGRYRIAFDPAGFPPVVGPTAPVVAPGPDVAAIFDKFDERLERKDAQITATNDRLMMAIMEMNKSTVQAITAMNSNRPQTDPLDNMEKLSTIINNLGQKELDGEAILGLLTKGMDLGERIGGGNSGGNPGILGSGMTIRDVLDGLKLLKTAPPAVQVPRNVSPAQPVQPVAAAISPVVPVGPIQPAAMPITIDAAVLPSSNPSVPLAPVVAVTSEVEAVRMNPFFKFYVPQLLDKARASADVAQTGEWIIGMVPTAYLEDFVDQVGDEDIVEVCAEFEPEARAHADWLRLVWQHVRKAVVEDDENPPAAVEGQVMPEDENAGNS